MQTRKSMGLIPVPDERLRELVPTLVHNIRGSLGAIRMGVAVVGSMAGQNGKVPEYISQIGEEVTRIDRTVKGLQRLVNVRREPRVRASVREAVADAVSQSHEEAARRTVTVENGARASAAVKVSAERLAEAIGEVLSNALRCSPVGGRVRIWAAHKGEGLLAIHVDDQGDGVAAEWAQLIGRPFFSHDERGAGLGLALASKICHVSGGRLEWKNLKPRGCRFSLLLPAS
jgi:signal transduction histidine kinase